MIWVIHRTIDVYLLGAFANLGELPPICPGKNAPEKMPHYSEAPLRHQHLTELKLETKLIEAYSVLPRFFLCFSFHLKFGLIFSSFPD